MPPCWKVWPRIRKADAAHSQATMSSPPLKITEVSRDSDIRIMITQTARMHSAPSTAKRSSRRSSQRLEEGAVGMMGSS
ncbi:hypothetical protein D3C72_2210170 [compost metagenome]